ncbi:EPIDERMAL PATTERNING FACTOR-like protein 9 isoform X2 [Cucumis sativus]|uniref:EPIDERMAL PATTERNING FACTOR-like protein 9 isoform X2 n=1 Tax=Cucumis sativus TaxID=3659 RepID=UPI0012F4B882|nr:EPIDERMAL PATTERNING FACTOR-like protein 9 isoform X2 [Cucumis sativus]
MAKAAKPLSVLLLLLLLLLLLTLFITSLFSTMAVQGFSTRDRPVPQFSSLQPTILPLEGRKERLRKWRRVMIGSTAPTCTYNECRGCKYKCRAEQVPVEGNDPINSAYHYRCVCHRLGSHYRLAYQTLRW